MDSQRPKVTLSAKKRLSDGEPEQTDTHTQCVELICSAEKDGNAIQMNRGACRKTLFAY